VKRHRISYHEKKLGQLFCDHSARDITNMLREECRRGSVSIILSCRISEVRRSTAFEVATTHGDLTAPALVIAAGGLSIPKLGATSFGYDLARQFGLRIVPPRPALVPLVFNDDDRARWCDLAGVAADVIARFGAQSFEERMLITHRGLSGPAILQISSYWDGRGPISMDLLNMPRRLRQRWAADEDRWEFVPAGTEGFAKAEVTAGGIHPDELSSKTMESKTARGLYCIGEAVDVTGHLGGFNFQWAWASAYAAAQVL
jgi:predicted Rossmann fold flavoprotein